MERRRGGSIKCLGPHRIHPSVYMSLSSSLCLSLLLLRACVEIRVVGNSSSHRTLIYIIDLFFMYIRAGLVPRPTNKRLILIRNAFVWSATVRR